MSATRSQGKISTCGTYEQKRRHEFGRPQEVAAVSVLYFFAYILACSVRTEGGVSGKPLEASVCCGMPAASLLKTRSSSRVVKSYQGRFFEARESNQPMNASLPHCIDNYSV
ncbi:hypothetical protein K490DRAFT_53555 [Saccharata proteae CBS 121410]|uniref:Uncharacterized protein n=1 Tax=Saccharata proteae CBS 121410 TaxID=1314787 RepID=A0A9P4I0L3_9PEZI|nr:hypothetical protein K490DRAFT_53555 [Saccharata proteae CBS 121410]